MATSIPPEGMILVGFKGKATPRSSRFRTEGVLDLREVVPGCRVAPLALQPGLGQRLPHRRHWRKEPEVLFRLLVFSPKIVPASRLAGAIRLCVLVSPLWVFMMVRAMKITKPRASSAYSSTTALCGDEGRRDSTAGGKKKGEAAPKTSLPCKPFGEEHKEERFPQALS